MICKAVTVELNERHYRWLRKRGDARISSEVVMVLPRAHETVLTLTKSFYPEGTYNLPSGGIEGGETPELAFAREVSEETGLAVELSCQLGRIDHRCTFGAEELAFVSHVMLATKSSSVPRPSDAEEGISGFLEASASDLRRFAEHMRSLQGDWSGFGAFRATALDFVADWLEYEHTE